jgi:CRISPR-associated protein Cas2
MLILVTYDVSVQDTAGKRRLNKIARQCKNYGIRVQNSVFECVIDSGQFVKLKSKLLDIMNEKEDSIRFYQLGNEYKKKVEHFGVKAAVDLEGDLIV